MATVSQTETAASRGGLRARIEGYPAGSLAFDWAISLLGLWMLAGLFLDGWAHNALRDQIETFFTPWHAVLYSGMLAIGGTITAAYVRNLLRGYHWLRALPRAYLLSLVGFGLFLASGFFDFVWHDAFGFEIDIEALLSPSHLLLATGAVLMNAGPVRSTWARTPSGEQRGWQALGPAVITMLGLASTFTFFTQYSNVFAHAHYLMGSRPFAPNPWVWDTAMISYFVYPAAILMFFILLGARLWRLPMGSMTLLMGGNAGLMFALTEAYNGHPWGALIAALAGGIAADGLYAVLRPSAERAGALRVFGFAAPFVLFLLVVAAMLITDGMWWRIHMWLGAPFISGVIGLGMTYLAAPPSR